MCMDHGSFKRYSGDSRVAALTILLKKYSPGVGIDLLYTNGKRAVPWGEALRMSPLPPATLGHVAMGSGFGLTAWESKRVEHLHTLTIPLNTSYGCCCQVHCCTALNFYGTVDKYYQNPLGRGGEVDSAKMGVMSFSP